MTDLEYIIVYTNDGTPVYSRCFANLCKLTLQDDTLLSAFLSALNQFAAIDPDNIPERMDLNGEMVKVSTHSSKVNSIVMEDLELLFHYVSGEELTIAVGTALDRANRSESNDLMSELALEIDNFYTKNYSNTDWRDIKRDSLVQMEKRLLGGVVHPFFDRHDMENSCPMGDDCPFRQALYDGKGPTLFDKISSKLGQIRTKMFG